MNKVPIQDGRVTVQNVQWRQTQGYPGDGGRGNAINTGFKRMWEPIQQDRKRLFVALTVKVKVTWQDSVENLKGQRIQIDVLSKVTNLDTYQANNVTDQSVQELKYSKQLPFINDLDIDITSDSNVISYENKNVQWRQTQGYPGDGGRGNAINIGFKRMWEPIQQDRKRLFVALTVKVTNLDTYQANNVTDQSVQELKYSKQPPFINDSDIDITSDSNVISYENKEAFEKDVKPFVKPIKEYFHMFDQGLAKETTNMREVFNQMETKVAKYSIDKKYFNIEKKELFIENDRLLEHIICQYVMCTAMHADLDNTCVGPANDNHLEYAKMEQSYIYEYNKVLELKAELSKKKETVEKDVYNELSKRSSRLEQHCIILEITVQQMKERMYKLDLEPLYPKVRKNKEAHVDYLKKDKEHADTLRDVIEQARAQQPLDSALEYACKFTTRTQELLVYVSATFPSSLHVNEKLVAITPMNKSKKVRFKEPKKSTSNIPTQTDSQNSKITNQPLLPSAGVKWYAKSNKNKDWKPTSNVFPNVRYRWIPTGRTFAIDGNKFPLNRITSTTIVPPKKPFPTKVVNKTPPSSKNPRKPNAKNVEAVAIACYTKNRSLIRKCLNKTPYELLHDKKPDLTYFHVFGALCYPTNDSEDLGKLKTKADIRIFIGYSPVKKAYRIYNKQTHLIMETIHVEFDELTTMASEEFDSGPKLQLMTPRTITSGLAQNPSPSTPYVPPTKKDWDILFQPIFDEYF
nr:retrovirus-related Pol polyprotein from transposon TNT 1-94 [Tanacetum cinerariifolium]